MSSKGLLSIPEYYKRYINHNVDLSIETKQCCPFHHEDTPSFSYSPERGTWRCFGACHKGGDVIDLHQLNYKLSNREEAKRSLMDILGIKEEVTFEDIELFSRHIGPAVKMKAAGGISSLEDAEHFLELGADRLGTSRVVKIAKSLEAD